MKTRKEQDSLGEIELPADALYGAQTARALRNFSISGAGIGREMIGALGLVKEAAALVNKATGRLDSKLAAAIAAAAREVARGDLDEHFPVDVFQTGSGTSSNMNANEVIANRAIQLLGGEIGSKSPVHPNDHVNMGQSSNDIFPTAIHVAALTAIEGRLLPALHGLQEELDNKTKQFDDIVKVGRTHLQDAVPIRLGQEFSGFASQIEHGIEHLTAACGHLRELAVGGTAVGTGINTHPEFGKLMAAKLSEAAGSSFVEAANHFEAQSARDAAVRVSGALRSLAVSLIKIADDIRWLGSGPRFGLGELKLPAVQPGSSIMPGKVNPVIAEALMQAAVQVIGNDAAIAAAGLQGNFQLNTMQPLIARNLLEQVRLLSGATLMFTEKLLSGIEPDRERLAAGAEQSLSLATALAPLVGYDRAAEIAKRAEAEGKSVRQVAREEKLLPDDVLERLLDPRRQTER
jgi:fumarate hydratase class II